MKFRYVCRGAAAASVGYITLILGAEIEPVYRPFHAEQREEIWYSDGQRQENVFQITRLANRSFLAVHPLASDQNRFVQTGYYHFYLHDTERHVQYSGATDLKAAWPNYNLEPTGPGRDPGADQYGDCSVLSDHSVNKVEAGKIKHFSVLRVERTEGTELHTSWIAPELGCFPLRSQVLVDGLVRERVDNLQLDLLPADTRLSLPKGTRIVSPQAYCDLYRKRHGHEYLPAEACSRYQGLYEEATGGRK